VILEVGLEDARVIYDKLRRHSFVERHPYGLKFHDKIRELLLERLKFTSKSEYDRLTQRLMAYYAEKAGIVQPEEGREEKEASRPAGVSKYTINIYGPMRGLVIGDEAQVRQQFGDADDDDNRSGG